MYVLGIAPFAYSSAALLKDGQLVAAAAEERFTRVKRQSGWPTKAIEFVLKEAGITLQEVDHFALPNLAPGKFYRRQLKDLYLNGLFRHYGARPAISRIMNIPKKFVDDFAGINLKWMGRKYKKDELSHIEHHIAHSAAAFRCSPFDKSLIMTIDGEGDTVTTMLSLGYGNTIEVQKRIQIPHSMGRLYDSFARYLGYSGEGNEEKIMGLAAYGKPNKNFDGIISLGGKYYSVNPHYSISSKSQDNLTKRFGPANISLETDVANVGQHYIDLAATLQNKLEQVGLKLLKTMKQDYGGDYLCIGGGSALNVKMNGVLIASGLIKGIYSQPASNDTGNSLGAALEAYAKLGYKSRFRMDHCYWGPEYSNEEIEKILKEYKLKYKYYKDIAGVSAKLLSKGKIMGWFQGRMEWGPRALGARSILVDPRHTKNRDDVNNHVKFRENWRPFCPSMLFEAQDEYLEHSYWSPFMNLAFQVKEPMKKDIPAVTHVDGSTRPQSVEKRTNPLYWNLIKEFENITGVPVLLNTSFNIKGEPIVCSPRDAVMNFFATGMDAMAIGNYLIEK